MRNSLKSIPLILSILLVSIPGFAQGSRWTAMGPEGGAIAALVQHPVQEHILYAVLEGKLAQLFRSTDRGLRWTKCWEFESDVSCLKVSSHYPNSLYALSGSVQIGMIGGETQEQSRLYESKDQGKSWITKPLPSKYAFTKIEFDPKEPSTIHALGQMPMNEGTMYLKSTDGASSWVASKIFPDKGLATTLTIDQTNPANIYVGAYAFTMANDSKFLFKSTDGGKSFSAVALKTNFISMVNDVVLDQRNPGRIFFLNYGGVYRSADGGVTWQRNKVGVMAPRRLWIDPTNSAHVFAVANSGIAESRDGGVTFKEPASKLPGSGISSFIVSSEKNSFILISNSAGIFRTTNLGKSWSPSHRGILGTQITSLRLSAASRGTLLAGVMNNAVYKTAASGAPAVSWEQLPVFYTCSSIGDIQVIPTKPYKILAIEGGG
jgi:photosystem II stability/assembly factor-like uncharacterized protein